MNLISYIILALIVAAMVAAIRYTRKHGSCSCGSKDCHCGTGSCGGNCAETEQKYMEEWSKKHPELLKKQ